LDELLRQAREVMEWMGHADLTTTRRYLAFVAREDAAKRVSEAFGLEEPQKLPAPGGLTLRDLRRNVP